MTRRDAVPSMGRRLAVGTLLAAAIALPVSALGQPAIATARQPSGFLDCIQKSRANDHNTAVELCCIQAGGFVVADRETGDVRCFDHEPTKDECEWVIGPNCTRQLPPGRPHPTIPPEGLEPVTLG